MNYGVSEMNYVVGELNDMRMKLKELKECAGSSIPEEEKEKLCGVINDLEWLENREWNRMTERRAREGF